MKGMYACWKTYRSHVLLLALSPLRLILGTLCSMGGMMLRVNLVWRPKLTTLIRCWQFLHVDAPQMIPYDRLRKYLRIVQLSHILRGSTHPRITAKSRLSRSLNLFVISSLCWSLRTSTRSWAIHRELSSLVASCIAHLLSCLVGWFAVDNFWIFTTRCLHVLTKVICAAIEARRVIIFLPLLVLHLSECWHRAIILKLLRPLWYHTWWCRVEELTTFSQSSIILVWNFNATIIQIHRSCVDAVAHTALSRALPG